MKIIKTEKQEILKEDFEKKLGIKIKEWIRPEDDSFLKIYTENDYIIYLRCEDIKTLFGFNINVFDTNVKFEKNKIVLKDKREVYKGKVKPLSRIIRE
jgi:hypothetical protein